MHHPMVRDKIHRPKPGTGNSALALSINKKGDAP
jgi:hypothetical protein